MPFGAAFAIVFFGALAPVLGAACLTLPGRMAQPLGALVLVAGWAIAAGLALRQRWARWIGLAGSAMAALLAAALVAARSITMDHVVLLAAFCTFLLLLLPWTGRMTAGRSRVAGKVLGGIAVFAIAGQAGIWALLPTVGPATSATVRTPAAASGRNERLPGAAVPASNTASGHGTASIAWTEFSQGLKQAKTEGKPVFVEFFATWCGYCREMEEKTFRDPSVRAALAEIVAVRVDGEGERPIGGQTGADLAARYRVSGFPTLLMLDPAGKVVQRSSGYMPPRLFMLWLKSARSRMAMEAQAR